MTKVYTVAINHRYGQNVSVVRTQEEVSSILHQYVNIWWDDEIPQGIEKDDNFVEVYFEIVEDESYSVEEVQLSDEPKPNRNKDFMMGAIAGAFIAFSATVALGRVLVEIFYNV